MLRSLEAAGWIVTRSRFRPDRSQTSCVFQWAKAPDLHVRPPRTSASGLEFNIGSIQESKTYAAAAECDFEQEQTAPVAAELSDNCPEADPKVNCPEGKENLPDSMKGPVNWPDLNGTAPDSVVANLPQQTVAAELVAVDASNDGSKQGGSNETPSKPAIPAIRSRKPSPKFIVIDGSKFLDINHGKDIYHAAVAGKLLNSGTVDRLAFFACWCAIAAKLRAGKVQHPERMMRFLLDNRKAMSAYPDHAAELKAREAVRFLFPEKPYNPHC
jgi:hypothetical protein